jgi:hypothetical protein
MPFCITVIGFPAKIEASHGNRDWKLETGNGKLEIPTTSICLLFSAAPREKESYF